jgi:phosphoribosyl 1,2-cyclic phosphodiesterase
MAREPVFTITYWGTTGTLTAPLQPPEVTEKLVRAIQHLLEANRLADLRPGPHSAETIRRRLEEDVPFHLRSTYGGNTTCVEVQTPDALLILDCGSGFRELGIALSQRWNAPTYHGSRAGHVLITHAHMDHTYATPYIGPYYDPRNYFSLWGSQAVLDSLTAVLSPQSPLSHTYFPPSYDMMKALRDFHPIQAGDEFTIGSTRIRTMALNHPGGCLAFRLENAGRVFVFATDHEHPEVPDRNLVAFAQGADVLYLDGQYLAAEYEGREAIPGDQVLGRRGWGHSTVEACAVTAVAAQVKALHVGHLEPQRTDEQIAWIESYLQRLMGEELRGQGRRPEECRGVIPYEGMTVQF